MLIAMDNPNYKDVYRQLEEQRYLVDQDRRWLEGKPRQSRLEWMIQRHLRRRPDNVRQTMRGHKHKVRR